LNLSELNKPYLYEFVHVDDFEDTCKELTELDLISRYTKPYIEEEGSSDEDDLENALQHIEIEETIQPKINRYFSKK